jgi:RHS repeat-associated protein
MAATTIPSHLASSLRVRFALCNLEAQALLLALLNLQSTARIRGNTSMSQWRVWGFLFLLLLAGNAAAGQNAVYWVDDRYGSVDNSALPHYRSPEEACVKGEAARTYQGYQQGSNQVFRSTAVTVGFDDFIGMVTCDFVIEQHLNIPGQSWVTRGQFHADVYGPNGNPDTCTPSSYGDPVTTNCGQPKCTPGSSSSSGSGATPQPKVGNPIDAPSGNKCQPATDFIGAGAYPLNFTRTYNSGLTWLNNPVPIGTGWTHSYLSHIDVMPAAGSSTLSEAIVHRPDGSILLFNLSGGVWIGDPDVAEQLSVATDGNGDILGSTLTTTDDVVESYDAEGRLVSITNRDGLTQTLTYTTTSGGNLVSENDVQQVSDPEGHTLTFGYNSSGQLTSMTDGNGAITRFNYGDANGNLTSVVYPDLNAGTKTRTYWYNETANMASGFPWPNALTGITDENMPATQRYASFGYDSLGRATSSVHGLFATGTIDKTTLVFNADGSTTFTDALGRPRTYGFDVLFQVAHPASLDTPCDGCSAHDKARTYDPNGYTSGSTDFNGNGTTYNFTTALDSNGHPRGLETQRVEGIATNTAAERTITTQWLANFRVPTQRTVQDVSGATKALTRWTYSATGQLTFRCEIDPAIGPALNYTCGSAPSAPTGVRQWAYTYCASGGSCPLVGLMLTSKGPRTDVSDLTTYLYYSNTDQTGCGTLGGACHLLGELQSITNSLLQVTTYASYDKNGRPTRITDANGVPTDMTYHPRGWLTQRAVRASNSGVSTGDQITRYSYDGVGQVTQMTRPAGDFLHFTYDPGHRLTDVVDNLKNTIHYTLDNAGNRKEEDSRISSTAPILHKVLRVFDPLGRLQTLQNANPPTVPPGTVMSYLYDGNGNLQQLTDGRSHITVDTYDALNRLLQTEQDTTGLKVFTNYTNDALDRLHNVKDPQSLNTTYTYDALSNLTNLASRDTGVTTSKYDSAGNLKTRTDARKVIATYTYDKLNRLTAIAYTPTSTPSANVSFTYDIGQTPCDATLQSPFSKGHLTLISTATAMTTTLCYDRFGNLAYKYQSLNGSVFATGYTYDLSNRLIQTTTPSGTLIKYTRDKTGRITGVTERTTNQTVDTPVVSGVTYDPFGPVAGIVYGSNSRTLTRKYDQDYVIGSVVDTTVGKTDGLNLTFLRDAVSNLTQVKSSATTGDILLYDGLNRLTTVNNLSNALVAGYGYDGTGNRTSKQVAPGPLQQYTYVPNTHHLNTTDGSSTLRSYDLAGNTATIGAGLGFGYDNSGRMVQVNGPTSPLMQYAYDGQGKRVEKYLTGNAALTQFTTYDESGHNLGDYTNATTPVREMIWMDDLPVGVLSGATPTLAYIEPDHLGTPRVAIAASTNASVWTWSLVDNPFGDIPPPTGAITLNLRMPGQNFDAESGLNYNYFRDYDSTVGRYIESDPIGLHGGINTYAYVRGNPLKKIDVKGLETFGPSCSNKQQFAILEAIVELRNDITDIERSKGSECPTCNLGLAHQGLDFLGGAYISCNDNYNDSCAATWPHYVFLNPSIIGAPESADILDPQKGCGCFRSILLHESLHNVMYHGYSDESGVQRETKNCEHCAGNPDR